MSKLIDKIKSSFARNPQVDTAKKAVVQAAKSVATEVAAEVAKAPAKKKAPAAKKIAPRPEDADRAVASKAKKTSPKPKK